MDQSGVGRWRQWGDRRPWAALSVAQGMADLPVIELSGLSEAAKRAYILADNKLALNAGWDEAMLALEVGELAALGANMRLAGFSDRELQALAAGQNAGLTDRMKRLKSQPSPLQSPATSGSAGSAAADRSRLSSSRGS
jgi:hypothetical protein